ncbi:MAG: hypothetical protein CL526_09310 [Aequorivita sp.]|nr:hypothetical protein [Aequorivita sp.]|tara:strand:+ start:9569 stop:10774 length:1206 start_codon:yes stop_codon:yes gene_type:complete
MKIHFIIITLFAMLLQAGCTEPYDIETLDYENVLVVESTITDRLQTQIVKLSRSTILENPQILFEANANVEVSSSGGERYLFTWSEENGYYKSNVPFAAQLGNTYSLKIKTQDGKEYTSSEVELPPTVAIDEVFAERVTDPLENKDGVQIMVNTEDPSGNAVYFRYEYEETYKVVAPYPSPYTFEITNFSDENYTFNINLSPRDPQEICYSTEYATGINQVAVSELNENRIYRFPIKYLSKTNAKLQERYSILVKQYVQSSEAYTFYKIINDLGSLESLLSQGQPGYVAGNIKLNANPNEKVLGFFEVATVTDKRIYFNYNDFNLPKPPYFIDCDYLVLDYRDNTTLDNDPNDRETLFTYLSYFDYQIVEYAPPYTYYIAKLECTVCNSFSSNTRPDFWED